MATKTISLELDAYERLKRAKRGNESFSAVVRRARFEPESGTGNALLKETEALYVTGKSPRKRTFDYWARNEAEGSDASPSHWDD